MKHCDNTHLLNKSLKPQATSTCVNLINQRPKNTIDTITATQETHHETQTQKQNVSKSKHRMINITGEGKNIQKIK